VAGLVGMLNINGSMTKAGVKYSTLWSEDFTDEYFLNGLAAWLKTGACKHRTAHVKSPRQGGGAGEAQAIAKRIALDLRRRKSISRVRRGLQACSTPSFPTICFSQPAFTKSASPNPRSTTAHADFRRRGPRGVQLVSPEGSQVHFGTDEATELTENQVLWQCKTYIAACRIADDYGCETIGIQYQQGLKDLLPASDLVEAHSTVPIVRPSRTPRARSFAPASRSHISTKSTNAPASTGS